MLQDTPPCMIHGNELFITFPSELHSIGTYSQHPPEFYGFQINISDSTHLLGLDKPLIPNLYTVLTTLKTHHLKIEYAKQQLETSDTPITDLAFVLGFSSSNYFCTVFKKYLTISPTEYRQNFYNLSKNS